MGSPTRKLALLEHHKKHGPFPIQDCGACRDEWNELADSKINDRIGDAKARKATPLYSGCINYFPDALLAVAELSRIGNEQHNPGTALHWDRSKSGDEADALARHLVDAGKFDIDGVRHSTKVAWRALALLQKELEAALPTKAGGFDGRPRC